MVKIALAQLTIDYSNVQSNIKTGLAMIHSAIESQCELIVFPELWSTGFNLTKRDEYSAINQELIQDLRTIAQKGKIEITGSFLSKAVSYQNRFLALLPNSREFAYSKIHLFPGLHETEYLAPGENICVYPSVLGPAGASICFDLRFPTHFANLLGAGAEYHVIPAHWPAARINHWDTLLKARAIETLSYVIAVNSSGLSGNNRYGGHSSIISPDGETIFQANMNAEDVFVVEIDQNLVKLTRERYPFLAYPK